MRTYTLDVRSAVQKKSNLLWEETTNAKQSIGVTNLGIEIDRQPFFVIAGEFHFSRYPHDEWEDELLRMKLTGINVISTYVFWIYHEEEEGRFDWKGSNDLGKFVSLCQKHGLYVILRVGPYVHGEVRNGGLPDWLYGRAFQVRSNDSEYLQYVERFYKSIADQIQDLTFEKMGCIIGIQLENEYLHASSPWEQTVNHGVEYTGIGTEVSHMSVLKQMAESIPLLAPIMSVTGWDCVDNALHGFLPMLGGYGYKPWCIQEPGDQMPASDNYIYKDLQKNPDVPVAFCELMGGMQCWYKARFKVWPESIAAIANRAVAGGSHFLGYYMYHGGNNQIGKHSFLNENTTPVIDYDFQAPIGAYGQLRRSAELLRPLHSFLKEYEGQLWNLGTYIPEDGASRADDIECLRYAARADEKSGFVFLNNFQDHVKLQKQSDFCVEIELQAETVRIPYRGTMELSESVSCILPFNLELGQILLKSATTAPITKIEDQGITTYFFGIVEGVLPQMLLEGASRIKVNELDLKVQELNEGNLNELVRVEMPAPNHLLIYPDTCKRTMLQLQDASGREVRVCLLTIEECSRFWQIELGGQTRVLLTKEKPLIKNESLSLQVIDSGEAQFEIYPEPEKPFEPEHHQQCSIMHSMVHFFDCYHLTFERHEVRSSYSINGNKGKVHIAADEWKQLSQLWLEVRYQGDVANASIKGRLIQDHFYNGGPLEIGLKRFEADLAEAPIELYIRPKKTGEYSMLESDMALQREFRGRELANIEEVRFLPEIEICLIGGWQ